MRSWSGALSTRLPEWLPRGGALEDEVWERSHRRITLVMWLHLPALWAFGLVRGLPWYHVLADLAPIALGAGGASLAHLSRRWRSSFASLGLFAGGAASVHLAGGAIEAHFHFFVIVAMLALYNEWQPFLLGVLFIVVEHGLVGILAPDAVYAHAAAQRDPWSWALIHGGFVMAAVLVHVGSWSLSEQLAYRDPISGAANRTLLDRRLARAVEDARRSGGDASVLVVDLDGYRGLTDLRGDAVADALLVEIADRLRATVEPSDTVARMGSDEFAVVFPATGAEAAEACGRRILAALAAPYTIADSTVVVGACAGLATAEAGTGTALGVLRNAEIALRIARVQGRGSLVTFDRRMGDDAASLAELQVDLAGAVDRDELELHYQPIIDLADGHIVGTEALVRWQHPVRGNVSPGEFIPLAEQSELICGIGRWVLREACRQSVTWGHELGLDGLHVAVNVSARHLGSESFVDDVLGTARSTGLDPSRLVVEITEGVVVHDGLDAVDKLVRLRTAGVRIAIDDFGTGYSSLAYLQRFPFDILKIDRCFVSGLTVERAGQSLARVVAGIGDILGIEVIAEGVEDEDERDALQTLRCELAQGFLFSRPRPAHDLVDLLMSDARAAAATRRVSAGGDNGDASDEVLAAADHRADLDSDLDAPLHIQG
ncbi:MAG: bifunctional diguanylate cyclase/phosphodiesterase [Actinomycetota bacterium]|nr:bifunctional diguanylate cyclase/phosphodiesterase [Actinomycetota bacterium]